VKYEPRFAFECEGQKEKSPKDTRAATQSKAKAPVSDNKWHKGEETKPPEDMIHRVRSRRAAE